MKPIKMLQYAGVAGILFFTACKKNDTTNVSTPPFQVGQAVSDASPLSGSVKGTMLTGKTYTIASDVTINAGDTLLLQPGVTVNVSANANIIVKGVFLSLGTQSQPNTITAPNVTKQDNTSATLTSDPAWAAGTARWGGLNCDTTCSLFIMKWTHVQFCGAAFTTPPVAGVAAGDHSFAIMFQHIGGTFVLEDSWIYGTVDDAVRVTSGNVNIMRNTFEKCGSNTGEAVNVKSGTRGNIAYNLFIGAATNGVKASDAGATGTEENCYTYNNTFVDCGYRQASTSAHGGSVNYEKTGGGKIYNNLFVDCKKGLRIVNTADTNNIAYGNNFFYGDSLDVVAQFYPPADVTHPQATDIPSTATWLSNPASLVSINNPMFTTFSLPNANYMTVNYASGFNFHLQSGSPAVGKGTTTAFTPLSVVAISNNYGASEVTTPGADMGAYQTSGKGNQH